MSVHGLGVNSVHARQRASVVDESGTELPAAVQRGSTRVRCAAARYTGGEQPPGSAPALQAALQCNARAVLADALLFNSSVAVQALKEDKNFDSFASHMLLKVRVPHLGHIG
jgi:hypothetical protein